VLGESIQAPRKDDKGDNNRRRRNEKTVLLLRLNGCEGAFAAVQKHGGHFRANLLSTCHVKLATVRKLSLHSSLPIDVP
jgi:hypothetical protein